MTPTRRADTSSRRACCADPGLSGPDGSLPRALGWVQVVEAVEEQLSVAFENKRPAWLSALAAGNARQGRAGERDDVLAEL
jgi:hypothetical protein